MKSIFYIIVAAFLLSPAAVNAQQDIYHQKYGNAKQQTLDLFLPKEVNKKTPVIIMLHGGAWTLGGNEYTDKHARDMRARGFVVANVDYRYVNDSVHAEDLLSDIDTAVQWVQDNAKKYGYKAKGYNLIGISAGAHLALLYGYTTKRDIKSITAMCAPSIFDENTFLAPLYKQGRIKILEDLADAKYNPTPGADISAFKDVSPYFHIKNIPTQLIHGTADELVDYHISERFNQKLKEMGIGTNLILHPGKGHDAGMNSPDTEQQNLEAFDNWIRKYDKYNSCNRHI